MTRYLVTGGSGYVGSVLCSELVARGHGVRSLDLVVDEGMPAQVEQIRADVRDESEVRAAMSGVDVVMHNVAVVPLADDPERFRSVNVGGTETVLRAAAAAGIRKVVATSSSAVFGVPEHNPVLESSPCRPVEAYGRAKLESEWLCAAAVSRGLDVTVVRPRTVVGPGRLGIFGILFDWIADGVDVPVFDDGGNVYQFIHQDDLVDGLILAARPGPDVVNLGGADPQTMRRTLESVCREAATGSSVRSVPTRAVRPLLRASSRIGIIGLVEYQLRLYSESLWFDCSHAEQVLGWRAQHSSTEAVVSAYRWYVENRDRSSEGGGHHRSTARQGALGVVKGVVRRL
jgi:nucleoside-diphosphate-sugar epimerase